MYSKHIMLRKFSIWGFLLIICLSFTFISLPAYAAEGSGSCGSNLSWSLSGNTLTITGSGEMADYKDSRLAPWYEYAEEIHTVILPSGMTTIGDFAFYGCSNLSAIRIPDSVTEIGDYSFAECISLTSAALGNGVKMIGTSAFQQCEMLEAVTFPSSLISIGTKAFYRCCAMASLIIPANVTELGTSAFAYCTGLVRATVNSPIESLPTWTFYGCTALADISLAPSITSTGEYAFEGCNNLGTVYTQTHDTDVAAKLEQSITDNHDELDGNGTVGTHDMPDTSISSSSTDTTFTQLQVTEHENSTITITDKVDDNVDNGATKTTISAALENSAGWGELADDVQKAVNRGLSSDVTVSVHLQDSQVTAGDLDSFNGQRTTLQLTTDSGAIWKLETMDIEIDDSEDIYDLGITIEPVESGKFDFESEQIYHMRFAGDVDFPTTVGLYVGNPYQLATLYQKDGSELVKLQTVVVDADGMVWFSMPSVNSRADYYIGINVAGVTEEDAVIPEELYVEYGIDENVATLMDKDGTLYQITGRESRWGITGKQFAIYVVVAIAAVVLLVTIVMLVLNHMKKSKAAYARMIEEEEADAPIDEEALRMEILREMLEEQQRSKGE